MTGWRIGYAIGSLPAMWKNQLYLGDNLDVLRKDILSEPVDLIYLDPPCNSNASYNLKPRNLRRRLLSEAA